MTEHLVKCAFHYVSPDLVNTISSSIGIRLAFNKNTNEASCSCSFTKACKIRSTLAESIDRNPQVWLSIALPNQLSNPYIRFGTNIGNAIHVYFGSLLSSSAFLVHDTPLNDKNHWTLTFRNEQTLKIECQGDNTNTPAIYFTLPMKNIDKNILVIDGDTSSDIVLSIDTMTADVRKNDRLYGNNPIIESLDRCSDIVINISPKCDADRFLDYLRIKHHCQIFYTRVSVQRNVCRQWPKLELNWYPTDTTRYAISMLHSLGYLFDDKYLTNGNLQSTMIQLAEEDEKRFYQLALKAFNGLKECHWLDLATVFNQNQFECLQKEEDKMDYVGIVHLTPTRLYIMPKDDKSKGHRAMRHDSFQGENNFCLVWLKPDPPEPYLTDNDDALTHFQNIFESGIEVGGHCYHLFGASNSQLKEHSYWFIKAKTLDDIAQKRLQLGQLNQIQNVGIYVARLGLWFSKSDPTDIKLLYCQSKQEFDRLVQRGQSCVMSINDIERNGYCFTDGNGFISKGLAKRVAEKLRCCPKNLQQDIFPSAYQIRMAGCKGLLIVDPHSTFDQFYIKIRPSMKKFECDDWTLDICDCSRPTSTRLNNQIILLMSDLGVQNETFLRLQQQWFMNNSSRFINPDFLLKNKIPLPVNECRYMYGCAFETKLKPGTCFIRYQILNDNGTSPPNRQFQSVQGRVIVTKNPCPYAGDMLELTAVDLPELHHLSDVIVFSTQGDRPDFNKIAGSDLDGDEYFVYWGEEFHLTCSVAPLDYVAEEKLKHPTPISPQDVIKYYLSTLGATSYGEIYNLHAIIVDKNVEKHQQRTCQKLAIELARLFASAIDAGKTGYVIDKERIRQIRDQHGQTYPDFLMKYGKQYYRSKSIIGILYRNALSYKNRKMDELNAAFAQMGIEDNGLQVSTSTALTSLPVNNTTQLRNSSQNKKGSRSIGQATSKSMQ